MHPVSQVTFVIDSNPNYTNACVADCLFCAFYRRPGDKEAYTLSIEQVMEKIGHAASQGATTVLLQGGLNPELPLDYYTTLVRETRKRFPQVTPHFFTASEVLMMSEVSKKSIARSSGGVERSWPGLVARWRCGSAHGICAQTDFTEEES